MRSPSSKASILLLKNLPPCCKHSALHIEAFTVGMKSFHNEKHPLIKIFFLPSKIPKLIMILPAIEIHYFKTAIILRIFSH